MLSFEKQRVYATRELATTQSEEEVCRREKKQTDKALQNRWFNFDNGAVRTKEVIYYAITVEPVPVLTPEEPKPKKRWWQA